MSRVWTVAIYWQPLRVNEKPSIDCYILNSLESAIEFVDRMSGLEKDRPNKLFRRKAKICKMEDTSQARRAWVQLLKESEKSNVRVNP